MQSKPKNVVIFVGFLIEIPLLVLCVRVSVRSVSMITDFWQRI
jgi:hypothetical protein